MSFEKASGLIKSEIVFSLVIDYLGESISKYNGLIDTFYNCRETGLCLQVFNYEGKLNDKFVWVCECRNSDEIMVVTGYSKNRDINNMFDGEAYNNKKFFGYDYNAAANYIKDFIKGNN